MKLKKKKKLRKQDEKHRETHKKHREIEGFPPRLRKKNNEEEKKTLSFQVFFFYMGSYHNYVTRYRGRGYRVLLHLSFII